MGTVGTHGINRALYAKLPYDPIKDFAPSPWWPLCPTYGDERRQGKAWA
jgi:hypothetical protein